MKRKSRAKSHDGSSSSETQSHRNQDRNTSPVQDAISIHAPDDFFSQDEGQQDDQLIDDPSLGNDEERVDFATLIDEVYNLLHSNRLPRMTTVNN